MDVISRRAPMSSSSTLNPNAPMFVPSAYRTVEDFSNEWWALVQSSPWFRDYWLQENYQDPQNDPFFPDNIDDEDDDDQVFSSDNIDDHIFSSGDVDDLFADSHYPPNNVNTTTNTDTQTAEVVTEEEEKDFHKELVSMGLLKWTKGRAPAKGPRFIEKAPKFVNIKVSPRAIQQPR